MTQKTFKTFSKTFGFVKKKKGLTCSSKQTSMTRKTKQMHRIHTGRLTNHLNRRRRHGG